MAYLCLEVDRVVAYSIDYSAAMAASTSFTFPTDEFTKLGKEIEALAKELDDTRFGWRSEIKEKDASYASEAGALVNRKAYLEALQTLRGTNRREIDTYAKKLKEVEPLREFFFPVYKYNTVEQFTNATRSMRPHYLEEINEDMQKWLAQAHAHYTKLYETYHLSSTLAPGLLRTVIDPQRRMDYLKQLHTEHEKEYKSRSEKIKTLLDTDPALVKHKTNESSAYEDFVSLPLSHIEFRLACFKQQEAYLDVLRKHHKQTSSSSASDTERAHLDDEIKSLEKTLITMQPTSPLLQELRTQYTDTDPIEKRREYLDKLKRVLELVLIMKELEQTYPEEATIPPWMQAKLNSVMQPDGTGEPTAEMLKVLREVRDRVRAEKKSSSKLLLSISDRLVAWLALVAIK